MPSSAQVARRQFVRTVLGSLAAAPFAARALAQDAALADRVEFRRLVAANRVLAHEEVVDAFGHISVRDPENAKRYVMARSRSPELVEYADLIRFEQDGRSLHYIVVLLSNVLKKDSAEAHEALGTRIHELMRAAHEPGSAGAPTQP